LAEEFAGEIIEVKMATKIVNENNIDNLGENPEVFMDGFQQIAYEANLQKIQNQKLDERFLEQKARKESQYLSRISSYIVSAWDLLKIFAQRKEGEVIVVDFDGNIFRGRLSEDRLKKMTKVPGKVPQHVPSNLDDAEFTYQGFVSKSVAEPANIVRGFSNEWNSAVKKAAKNQAVPMLDMFLRLCEYKKSQGKTPEIHHEISTGPNGIISGTFWADFMDVKFTVNRWGRVLQFESHGIVTEL
jgi:hypothetical protein